MAARALEGVKILDFSWALIGPITTKYMADHGATIVRVESARAPDSIRIAAPYKDGVPGLDRSGYFAHFNPNKYSMTLDLNNPSVLSIVEKLVEWAGVVVENFRPGVMEKWGLGYEDLKRMKPDIIMLRLSNRGQTGPSARHGTFAVALNGEAGFSHLTGWQDKPPLPLPVAYLDSVTPRFAAAALMAALLRHRRTGKGICLDISQLEVGAQFLSPLFLDFLVNGREAERAGNSEPCAAPHGVYRCKGDDEWCAIAVFTEAQWSGFGKALGYPSWSREDRFTTTLRRKKNESELNKLVEAFTMEHTADDVMKLLVQEGVPAGIVQSAERIYNDPQLKERHQFWKMDHKVLGQFSHMGEAFILSKTPSEPSMPAPCLGEHTEHICREILKMSDEEFIDLYHRGAFGP